MTKDNKTRPPTIKNKEITGPASLLIDWDLYGQYLEGSNLSDTENRETIQALWSIVVSFVDLGFKIHPAQLATKDNCEQTTQKHASIAPKSNSMVSCLHSTKQGFSAKAGRKHSPTQERSSQ